MPDFRHIHMVPIGGTAMVPLAALLSEEGHRVTGSDRALYPPMSTKGLTMALTKRFICGRSGSFETTSTDFEIGPANLFVSTLV